MKQAIIETSAWGAQRVRVQEPIHVLVPPFHAGKHEDHQAPRVEKKEEEAGNDVEAGDGQQQDSGEGAAAELATARRQ